MPATPVRYALATNVDVVAQDIVPNELPLDVAAVYRYWSEKRGTSIAPAWRDFELYDLPAVLLRLAIVVDVIEEPLDFVYRYWGTGRTVVQGRDYTGRSIRDIDPRHIADKLWTEYVAVYRDRRPIHFINEQPLPGDNDIKYQMLRLPLSDDGERVTKIFCVEFAHGGLCAEIYRDTHI